MVEVPQTKVVDFYEVQMVEHLREHRESFGCGLKGKGNLSTSRIRGVGFEALPKFRSDLNNLKQGQWEATPICAGARCFGVPSYGNKVRSKQKAFKI